MLLFSGELALEPILFCNCKVYFAPDGERKVRPIEGAEGKRRVYRETVKSTG